MRKILYAVIAVCALASCKKDDTLRYNNMTMGNIDEQTIISDQGNTFNIVESLLNVDLAKFPNERVLLTCDVLKETSDNTYDIRLTSITNVLTKNVKTLADSTPEENLEIDDPLILRDIWYSGGYLNLYIEFFHKAGSMNPHFINLLHETSEDGKHIFTLRHNASGELPYEKLADETFYLTGGYVSFPISRVIEGNSADIVLNWKSYKFSSDGQTLPDIYDVTKEYKWTRGGYEHAPRSMNVKSAIELR